MFVSEKCNRLARTVDDLPDCGFVIDRFWTHFCTAIAVKGVAWYMFSGPVYVLDCVEISSCQSFLAHKSIERNEVTPPIITSDQSPLPISKSVTPPHVRKNHARWSLRPFPIKYGIVLTRESLDREHTQTNMSQTERRATGSTVLGNESNNLFLLWGVKWNPRNSR